MIQDTAPAAAPARKAPPPLALLLAFLRRTVGVGACADWVLRGSAVTRAHHPAARPPMDLDYLVWSARFDPARIEATVRALLAARTVDARFGINSMRTAPIWAETDFPGLRIIVPGELLATGEKADLGLDFGFGDPMAAPTDEISFHGVGPLRAVARETMVAWKVHGLVEWGRGRWRAKDLCDLHTLLEEPLDEKVVLAALELAFSSRKTSLEALADLLFRPAWGESTGRRKIWRSFARSAAGTPDFGDARTRLLALLDRLGLSTRLEGQRESVLAADRERREAKALLLRRSAGARPVSPGRA